MEIISFNFVLFTIISVVVFYLLNYKYKVVFLTILSCGFIISLNYLLLPYILFYAVINYYIGLKLPGAKNKVLLYRFGIVFSLTQLILFRYASFAIDPIFQFFGSNIHVSRLSEIILPLGISYFTLQGIGYLINVKMGWEKPEKKFPNFLLYISFFPKFLSGPIERSNHFLPQIKENKPFNEKQVSAGLRIVLIGFFKKVAIANQLAPYVFDTFRDINVVEGYPLLVLFFLLPLYLYFDFSGYTDIAIGFAKAFGIDLLPNFNRPFFSENMTMFWKRFHISLSSWFNDYVFRQTMMRRRKWGIYASVFAVFVTWIFFGIWHGGGWNFMLLGVLQALAIIYEFFTKKIRIRLFSSLPKFFNVWMGRVSVYLFYCVSMVFFFSPNLETIFTYFSKLFTISGPVIIDDMSTKPFALIIYIPIFLFLELLQNDFGGSFQKLESFWISEKRKSRYFRWLVYSIIITIIFIVGLKAEQFVYANF